MKKIFFTLIVVTTMIIIGCDKIDDPTPNNFVSTDGIVWDDSLYIYSH